MSENGVKRMGLNSFEAFPLYGDIREMLQNYLTPFSSKGICTVERHR